MVVSALGLVLVSAAPAGAATQAETSNEIGGTSVAAHAAAQGFQSAWATQVVANGGTAEAPMTLTQPAFTNGAPVTGIIDTAADGTTTSIARTRYSAGGSPSFVEVSPNPGTATCTTAGRSLQGGAPRPTVLESNATCGTPAGFAYAEQGGVGESTTRDAVEFTFSRPVLGFGAWFGDLETRTDGNGVPAVVRLYGGGDALLSDQVVEPGPNYLPQSSCGGGFTGCGNNTTRWIGFVADPAQPVTRMVVIVGDDAVGGDALGEGLGLIGPTLDLSTAAISLAKTARPLTDTNGDGIIGAGDDVRYDLAVTNTGSLPVSSVSIDDPLATELSCPAGPVPAAGVAQCTGTHVLTQAEVDSGSFSNTATAAATAYGGTIISSPSTAAVPIPSDPGLSLTKTVDEPTFAAPGDVLHFEVTATNTGNVTLRGVSVTDPAPGDGTFDLDCAGLPATLAPGASGTCAASYTVTQADLDAGRVVNRARASATDPSDGTQSAEDTAASTAQGVRALALSKRVAEKSYSATGDLLHYTITARNTGTVTLTNVRVKDPAPGTGRFTTTCGTLTTLAPGQVSVCTASYTVAARDLAAAQVRNTASAAADGQVDAVTASATSKLKEEPSPHPAGTLPDTGARDLHHAGLIGLALVCTGAFLVAWGRRRRA